MPWLFNAVLNNDVFLLQEMFMDDPDLDPNQPVIGSLTALHVAAEKGYSSCAKVLLSAGADVNATDEQGLTPIMTAILAGFPLTVANLLHHPRCDVNHVTITGMSALHYAARQGSYGTVQLLIQRGADPSVFTHLGRCSPLSLAIQNGHTEVVKALILGNTFVDANTFAQSDDVQMPIYESLKKCRSVISKLLLIGGYRKLDEIHTYMTHFSSDRITADVPDMGQILSNSFTSLDFRALIHLCRLTVRRQLGSNIWARAEHLPLPKQLTDYITFRDIYEPPKLNTPTEVYNFFCDNSREIYELV